ncbi:dihydroxy-acid dehydratase [Cupriavidus basilensis]|uniref:dihydroxy-acid dehydratase n=1 Tax=Cupriavidus basilensis TaxID=68895 RepID=UPI00157AF8E8|nr:dihydroxy-acid dehydratase [Cupriavidus basilensis]NUA27812.1 dihydroxy-acid dehydratase [Cupriavidus basilensis]
MNSPKYRSNFAPGTTRWALRKAQWQALGLSDADLDKPKIAVVNTSSELSSCFSHLDGVSAYVKAAIRAAGGVPFEVRTAAPSDFITSAGKQGRYILPSRDLIVNDIEVQVEGAQLDGMVCLASCDKTTPGQMMAAARLNIPTLVVICGYQASGQYKGEHVDIEDVFEKVGMHVTGQLSFEDLDGMCKRAVRSPGVCAGLGTANSMHIVCEALGLTLPGASPVLANSPAMVDQARAAGARIVEMVNEGLTPRSILTPAAFRNAVRVALALSTSINVLRHLQGVAEEAGTQVDLYDLFDRLGREVPLLATVKPNGPHRTEELEAAGGTLATIKRLTSKIEQECLTVSGKTWKAILDEYEAPSPSILRTLDNPISTKPSLVILKGSLAPEGSILKLGNAAEKAESFRGRAMVFHSQEEAITALADGRITEGTVACLRGMGPIGGPGVALASSFVAAVEGAGFNGKVAVVTDGQLSGLNRGVAVGQVCPEAAAGGPLALVKDGDDIEIDIPARQINLLIDENEMASRRAEATPIQGASEQGWLSIYSKTVTPLARGAVLIPIYPR